MAITAQAIVDRIQQKLGLGWKDPSVDTFLAGNRDSEYDTFEYARDAVFAGVPKGVIYISHEASEDVGMDWFAKWLRPFIPEVPVRCIPTSDDFWTG